MTVLAAQIFKVSELPYILDDNTGFSVVLTINDPIPFSKYVDRCRFFGTFFRTGLTPPAQQRSGVRPVRSRSERYWTVAVSDRKLISATNALPYLHGVNDVSTRDQLCLHSHMYPKHYATGNNEPDMRASGVQYYACCWIALRLISDNGL
jgi:hypothetical protein